MSKPQIDRYAFKVPLMFEGDRGSGKTYDVREFARSAAHPYLEIAGNESLEAFDFLGHVMQSEHGMIWKDGKLSQAFRMAREGKRVVLLIDEMLRIPQRHLSVLLSALSPDSDGNYRLQTGRMVGVKDGIGSEEEIVAPAGNLAIFATTNVGPEFAIDDLDPAVAERFIILRKDTELSQLTKILEKKAELRLFSKMVALKLTEFFSKTQRMVKTGTLNRHATTRTLARAIDIATDEADVAQVLRDQVLLWADRDASGQPVKEQTAALIKTINELFAEAPKAVRKPAPAAPIAPPPPRPSTIKPKAPLAPSAPSLAAAKSAMGRMKKTPPHAGGFSAAAAKMAELEAKHWSKTPAPAPSPVSYDKSAYVYTSVFDAPGSAGSARAARSENARLEADKKAKLDAEESAAALKATFVKKVGAKKRPTEGGFAAAAAKMKAIEAKHWSSASASPASPPARKASPQDQRRQVDALMESISTDRQPEGELAVIEALEKALEAGAFEIAGSSDYASVKLADLKTSADIARLIVAADAYLEPAEKALNEGDWGRCERFLEDLESMIALDAVKWGPDEARQRSVISYLEREIDFERRKQREWEEDEFSESPFSKRPGA